MYPGRKRSGASYRGFIKRLIARGEHLLKVITPHLRQRLKRDAVQHGCWKIFGFAIFGVDSTSLSCPRTRSNHDQLGATGTGDVNVQILITSIFHVGSNVLWAFARGLARGSERAGLLSMLQLLPKQSLLLADAGFVGYQFFATLIQSNRHLLVRGGSHLQFLRKLGVHAKIHDDIVYLWPEKKRKGHQPPIVLRLLIVTDSRNRKMGLLTSVLDRQMMSDKQMTELYKMRWSVEVKYRTLKQVMNRRHLLSDSPRAAQVEADFTMLGLWMLEQLHFSNTGRRQRAHAAVLRAVRRCLNGTTRTRLLESIQAARPDLYERKTAKQRVPWPQRKRQKPQLPPKARMATGKEIKLAQRINQFILAA